MIKILFVCHGNICRSPMAEFIMKDIVKGHGKENLFEIQSAATSAEEIGNPVYPPARKKLSEHGISSDGKFAKRMTRADAEYFDYIIAMDKYNIRNIAPFVDEKNRHKVSLMLDYTDTPGDVSDPWYTNNFDKTWIDIYNGCTGLYNKLLKNI